MIVRKKKSYNKNLCPETGRKGEKYETVEYV